MGCAVVTHCLVRWYCQGRDIHSLLIHLPAYLGHIDIAGAQEYLTMTPELSEQASARFARYALGGAHLRAWARYVGINSPEHLEWSSQMLTLHFKKHAPAPMNYLEKEEMKALLAAPDQRDQQGFRDYVLLRLLLKDITVEKRRAERKAVLHIRWQGGAVEDLPLDLPVSAPDNNHLRVVRGPPGCPAFRLLAYRPLYRLRLWLAALDLRSAGCGASGRERSRRLRGPAGRRPAPRPIKMNCCPTRSRT